MKELEDAGYYLKEDEAKPIEITASGKKAEKKKRYATIHANDLELPIRIKGLESGDKLMMTAVVNVDEVTSLDSDKSYDNASRRFNLSIEKCSFTRALAKSPEEMTDDELSEANSGRKKK